MLGVLSDLSPAFGRGPDQAAGQAARSPRGFWGLHLLGVDISMPLSDRVSWQITQ